MRSLEDEPRWRQEPHTEWGSRDWVLAAANIVGGALAILLVFVYPPVAALMALAEGDFGAFLVYGTLTTAFYTAGQALLSL